MNTPRAVPVHTDTAVYTAPVVRMYIHIHSSIMFTGHDIHARSRWLSHLLVLPPGSPVGIRHGNLIHVRHQGLKHQNIQNTCTYVAFREGF